MDNKLVRIDNTRFIWKTNFSGDPDRDAFGNRKRQVSIIIPDVEQARDLIDEGFNVRTTKPREDDGEEFVPDYYVKANINYDSDYPPKIYLVSGRNRPRLLDEESVGMLDKIRIENVRTVLSKYLSKRYGTKSLYVKTMYVEQGLEDDPFASMYVRVDERDFDEVDIF